MLHMLAAQANNMKRPTVESSRTDLCSEAIHAQAQIISQAKRHPMQHTGPGRV
jgi:hypothetical protein